MNFIVIISDSFRRDHMGCYGNSWISTPHIDAFAAGAQVYDEAYTASFPTVPHRRDVMTGCFTAAYTPWEALTPGETVISDVLSKNGYSTMMILDTPHIMKNGYHFDRGFDGWEWIRGQETDHWKTHPREPVSRCDPSKLRNPEGMKKLHRRSVADRRYEADTFVARTMTTACNWLEDNHSDGPFFLYVDGFDPHEPWDAPQWFIDRYDPGYVGDVVDYPRYAPCDYLTAAELKHCRALYAAECTLVDRWVGRLMEKIADLGLEKDTMVLFTADHGFLIGEHGVIGKSFIEEGKSTSYIPLYDELNHIPWIIRFPGAKPGHKKAIVQPQDIMPTVLDLAGVPVPETVNGRSFVNVLRGEADTHRSVAVSVPYLKFISAKATVVKGPWRGILLPKTQEPQTQSDKGVDGIAKLQRRGEDTEHLFQTEQLYHFGRDPQMLKNVRQEHPEILEDLRQEMYRYFEDAHAAKDVMDLWR